MKSALTTPHLLFAALALAFALSTAWTQVRGPARPADAASRVVSRQVARHEASRSANPGFSGAFGDGTVVRNLLY